MSRYRGRHRPGSPRVLLIDGGRLMWPVPDGDELEAIRREWETQRVSAHFPTVYLREGIEFVPDVDDAREFVEWWQQPEPPRV